MKDNASHSPIRVQLRRVKGWKMPANTVNVARPSRWGNPFSVENNGRTNAVKYFREWLEGKRFINGKSAPTKETIRLMLRGHNLACYCDPKDGLPCHADVLLELANAEAQRPAVAGTLPPLVRNLYVSESETTNER